ncbi:hypothetical protein ACS15_5446 [Ralstonia insidiosa]|uniref:Uncharacterized protein n=1 Tax=Ralstonia insidiosa TaxID=190721 RepID=A0AAC9BPA7_9RALS|nr:hypothetical protein ACS15_5446 [Ralstonia insidiosa]
MRTGNQDLAAQSLRPSPSVSAMEYFLHLPLARAWKARSCPAH